MKTTKRAKRYANGEVRCDQGAERGYPITYNPDDGLYYAHARGVHNGTGVLGMFQRYADAVLFCWARATVSGIAAALRHVRRNDAALRKIKRARRR